MFTNPACSLGQRNWYNHFGHCFPEKAALPTHLVHTDFSKMTTRIENLKIDRHHTSLVETAQQVMHTPYRKAAKPAGHPPGQMSVRNS
jgi:hypothetical protein